MNRKISYREVRIPLPIYKSGVIVMITKDTKRAAANVRKWYKGDFEEWDAYSVDGKTISKDGYTGPVIWIREEPNTPYRIGVLSHEVFHAVCRIFNRIGIPLSYESEEAYNYLQEHIFTSVLETKPRRKPKLKKRKK